MSFSLRIPKIHIFFYLGVVMNFEAKSRNFINIACINWLKYYICYKHMHYIAFYIYLSN